MSLTVIAQRMGNTSFQRLVTGLVLSTLLVGCSSTKSSNVRVVDRNSAVAQRPAVTTGQYVVRLVIPCFRSPSATAGTTKPWLPGTIFLRRIRSIRVRRFASTAVAVQRRPQWSAAVVRHLPRRAKPQLSDAVQMAPPPLQPADLLALHRPSQASRHLRHCLRPARPRPAGDGHLMAF